MDGDNVKTHRDVAKEYLESLSREELKELLIEAGFEVSDGNGEIIFTETPYVPKPKRTIEL